MKSVKNKSLFIFMLIMLLFSISLTTLSSCTKQQDEYCVLNPQGDECE